ncbi:hypothetical protein ARTHROSP310_24150 [Arthrobacter sp. AD-310]
MTGADGTVAAGDAVPAGAGAERVGSAPDALPVDVPVAAALAVGAAEGAAVADGAGVGTAVADADRVAVTAGSSAGGTEATGAGAEEVGCAVGSSWPAVGAYR